MNNQNIHSVNQTPAEIFGGHENSDREIMLLIEKDGNQEYIQGMFNEFMNEYQITTDRYEHRDLERGEKVLGWREIDFVILPLMARKIIGDM